MRLDDDGGAEEEPDRQAARAQAGFRRAGDEDGGGDGEHADDVALEHRPRTAGEVRDAVQRDSGPSGAGVEPSEDAPGDDREGREEDQVGELEPEVRPTEQASDRHVERERARHAGDEDVAVGHPVEVFDLVGREVQERRIVHHAPVEGEERLDEEQDGDRREDRGKGDGVGGPFGGAAHRLGGGALGARRAASRSTMRGVARELLRGPIEGQDSA